jgi:hypothetical protein
MTDAEQKISRPRQIYLGEQLRRVPGHNKAADTIAVKQRRPVAVR